MASRVGSEVTFGGELLVAHTTVVTRQCLLYCHGIEGGMGYFESGVRVDIALLCLEGVSSENVGTDCRRPGITWALEASTDRL
jgi:hypothetical protein